jgi:hypothetical protein
MRNDVWGSYTRLDAGNAAKWPRSARDSQTWLLPDRTEATLLAYKRHVQNEGLLPFGGYATPTQQRKGQQKRNAVWKLPVWVVGLRLVLGDCTPQGVALGTAGWWWSDGKKLAEALRGMPAGPPRVRAASAACSAILIAWSLDDLKDPVQAAWPVVRAARWR